MITLPGPGKYRIKHLACTDHQLIIDAPNTGYILNRRQNSIDHRAVRQVALELHPAVQSSTDILVLLMLSVANSAALTLAVVAVSVAASAAGEPKAGPEPGVVWDDVGRSLRDDAVLLSQALTVNAIAIATFAVRNLVILEPHD